MRISMVMGDPPRSVMTAVLVGALTIALFIVLSLTIVVVPDSVPTSGVAGEEDGPYTQLAEGWAWQSQRVGSPTAAA